MRYIPDDNLSYPILLALDNGSSGSGFYLNFDKKDLYIVTARHVLCKEENGKYVLNVKKIKIFAYDKNILVIDPYIAEIDLSLIPNTNIKISDSYDVVIVKIGSLTEKENTENKYSIKYDNAHTFLAKPKDNSSQGLVFIPSYRFKKYDDVLISNDVVIFGYPVSLGNSDQIDYKKPLLRKGIVAGKNIIKRTIILYCPSYQGNSGGIVLEIDPNTRQNFPIGIISSFVPFIETLRSVHFGYENSSVENSGYSIITPIDVILDLINK